jgi:3-deoxy-D-manno-octulosonate 8-phosphate phosphatase (KDO 8-P phosphatase)
MQAGVQVAIIPSASCEAVRARAVGLGIDLDEVAYMGDELPDLSIHKTVAFACAPADVTDEVKADASLVASRFGGAVREICDFIIVSRP